ncbi:tyrosine-type recombinase/integrase [Ruania albidiflava]|uniref:tyrosine-type recombinase/integrase n=1 Tax=Ruania albidiflava TaxID=366586 RepID=UPI0023F022A0|nr:site-specific integrase [Ruania albidiflava]
MARVATEVGEHGTVSVFLQARRGGRWITLPKGERADRQEESRWRARTRFRQSTKTYRTVDRYGTTKVAAERALRDALADLRAARTPGALASTTTVADAATAWRDRLNQRADLSPKTVRVYREAVDRFVLPRSLSQLTLEEANTVQRVKDFLLDVATDHGTGSAKTARSVLSSIMQTAVDSGALPVNAARGVPIPAARKRAIADPDGGGQRAALLTELGIPRSDWQRDTSRALTRAQRDHLLAFVTYDDVAVSRDVADLVWFLCGTGARISEALAVRWDGVDLERRRVQVPSAKRKGDAKGRDRYRSPIIPVWLSERLAERASTLGNRGYLFASPRDPERQRDASAVERALRSILDRAGFPWATAHTLRRTVVTLLIEQGVDVGLVADMVGHADPTVTLREYVGRNRDLSALADVL